MRTFLPLKTLIACLLLLLALPAASARANGADDRIVQDCQHSVTGSLTGSYPKAQLNHALHNLPGDVREYSGCYDAIRQALLASAGANGGNGGNGAGNGNGDGVDGAGGGIGGGGGSNGAGGGAGGGAGAPGAIPDAQPPAGAEQPVDVAGATIAPGTLPEIGLDSHKLPTPLLVLLILLAATALVVAALTIGRRVVARRRA
jgi:hypothetical protein